jgi:hypothetical protein
MFEERTLTFQANLFSEFEVSSDISTYLCRNLPIWEIIRFSLFQLFCVKSGVLDVGHSAVQRKFSNYSRYFYNISNSLVRSSLTKKREADFLVLGHPRLIKNSSGYFEDPYTESYLKHSKYTSLYLERSFLGRHPVPRLGNKYFWYDNVFFIANRRKAKLKKNEIESLRGFENDFLKITGISIDFVALVKSLLGRREILLPFFEKKIRDVKPKLAIAAILYQWPEFVEACRNSNVPVLEIQHGVISQYHYGYHHQSYMPKFYYPDFLWLWGDYWKSAANFAENTSLSSVGFPHFENNRKHCSRAEGECLFISQGSVGKRISDAAIQLKHARPDLNIYFKLHPSELLDWNDKYADLLKHNIKIIGMNDGSLYDWLEKTHYVIGAYSTALFEAVCFGCRVGVLDLPGVEYMKPLIDQGGACLLDSNFEQLFDESGSNDFDSSSIFKVCSINDITAKISNLIDY